MKYLLLIALAATAMATDPETQEITETTTEATTKDLLAENFAHILGMKLSDAKECTRKWNTSSDDIFYIQQVYDDERENDDPVLLKRISCALHCCFEKEGLISDRDIQVAKFYRLSSELILPPGANARRIIRTCKAQVNNISDKCLVSFEFGQCAIRLLYGN